MKELLILRGVSGSGKSSLAQVIINLNPQGVFAMEADILMVNEEGEYDFQPEVLKHNHTICRAQIKAAMERDTPVVIVSNTSISPWEFEPYEALAYRFGYTVRHLLVENRRGGKDIHGCPEEKLEEMETKLRDNIILR